MDNETTVLEPSQGATESPEQSVAEDSLETQQAVTETGEAEEQTQGAEAGAETEDDANWLPSEQLKVFPQEVVARYAKRFGYTAEEIAADPRLANALSSKINSDIYIESLKKQGEETEPEGEEEGEAGEQEQTPVNQEQAYAEWVQRRDAFVDQITDPKVAQDTFKALNAAAAQSEKDGGVQFLKVLSGAAVNLMRDALPALLFGRNGEPGDLDRYIESRYEGLTTTVRNSARSEIWNNMISSDEKLANLPQYDPRPNSEWTKAVTKVSQLVPGFEKFRIPGASAAQNFQAKAQIAARLLANGTSPDAVQVATKAVETGKRQAKDAARQKDLGKLGAGQSKGALQQKTSDPLDAEIAKFNKGLMGLK